MMQMHHAGNTWPPGEITCHHEQFQWTV